MSWGERSCNGPCRALDHCNCADCNVDCPGYEWDGKTPPDSVPMATRLERQTASPGKLIPLMLATMMPDSGDAFQSLLDLMPREQGGSERTRERARKRKKARKRGGK